MVRSVSTEKMRQLEKIAIEDMGIPESWLMENAGMNAAKIAEGYLKQKDNKVVVFSGKGNNGGDGLVCARGLLSCGFDVEVIITSKIDEELSTLNRKNLNILKKLGIRIMGIDEDTSLDSINEKLAQADLIIDAIFGIGLKGEVRPPADSWIECINKSKARVLSIDIPSGLDSDKGKTGEAVRADFTVSFLCIKEGMLTPGASGHVGELFVVPIGIDHDSLKG